VLLARIAQKLSALVGKEKCRDGKIKLYLVKVRMPSEVEAAITVKWGPQIVKQRVIPKEIHSRWVGARFNFYNTIKDVGIKIPGGRIVTEDEVPIIESAFYQLKRELEVIEDSLKVFLNAPGAFGPGSEKQAEALRKMIRKRGGNLPPWLEPTKHTHLIKIPITMCREDYEKLLSDYLTGPEA